MTVRAVNECQEEEKCGYTLQSGLLEAEEASSAVDKGTGLNVSGVSHHYTPGIKAWLLSLVEVLKTKEMKE